ncbi:MAG: TonB-dependent receptor, partial [Bacteroidota bacterium]
MRSIGLFLLLLPSLLRAQQKDIIHHQSKSDSVNINDLLSIIHKQGDIQLSYDPSIIPNKRLLLEEGKWSVIDMLKSIDANTSLTFKKVGKNYILINDENASYRIHGRVAAHRTGEHLIGALVRIPNTAQGVITNQYGFYSLELPMTCDTVEISYLGFEKEYHDVYQTNYPINIRLKEKTSLLKEVTINATEESPLASPQFGHLELKADNLRSIYGVLGERDALRQLQQVAGVAMTSESSAGFSVRGGRPNQNLVLLDEAIVYNPTHFVGLFSVFNSDAVNKIAFYKGGIPSRYGGRLASITNVMMKEGNNQRFEGKGSINLLAASLSMEGPIKKNKGSYILSGRRSYPDIFFGGADAGQLFFHDINLKVNYQTGQKDRIYLSGYLGDDIFSLQQNEFRFNWGNAALTARWNHVFNEKLFLNTSYIFSVYDYRLEIDNLDQDVNWFTKLG